jgi:hypothetical protein
MDKCRGIGTREVDVARKMYLGWFSCVRDRTMVLERFEVGWSKARDEQRLVVEVRICVRLQWCKPLVEKGINFGGYRRGGELEVVVEGADELGEKQRFRHGSS